MLAISRRSTIRIATKCFSTTSSRQKVASESPESSSPSTTHFGFKTVDEEIKASLVGGVFSSVASSYDKMNDAMSFGIHRLWKDEFVKLLDPRGPLDALDVAGGTGDITLRILEHARKHGSDDTVNIICSDINPAMLGVGKQRFQATKYKDAPNVQFRVLDAMNLDSVPDNSLDLYTIAFGIRNTTRVPKVLQEAYRVLRPGGVFSCLEFGKISHPENEEMPKASVLDLVPGARKLLSSVYETYSFSVIPQMGQIIAADRDSYQYLVESIVRFPSQAKFAQMIRDAGFSTRGQGYKDLTFGVAAIHTGVKL